MRVRLNRLPELAWASACHGAGGTVVTVPPFLPRPQGAPGPRFPLRAASPGASPTATRPGNGDQGPQGQLGPTAAKKPSRWAGNASAPLEDEDEDEGEEEPTDVRVLREGAPAVRPPGPPSAPGPQLSSAPGPQSQPPGPPSTRPTSKARSTARPLQGQQELTRHARPVTRPRPVTPRDG